MAEARKFFTTGPTARENVVISRTRRKLAILVCMLSNGELNSRCLHKFTSDLFAFRTMPFSHRSPTPRRVIRRHLSGIFLFLLVLTMDPYFPATNCNTPRYFAGE